MATTGHHRFRLPHRAVILVGSATAFSLLGDQGFYAVLQTNYKDLGLLPLQVGILLSANRWIRLLTNHVAERLIHRVSPTRLLVLALFLGAVLTAGYGALPLFPALLAARIVWGFCWSLIRQVGIMTCADVSAEHDAARIIGFHGALTRVGFFAGTLGGVLLYDLVGFSPTFFLLGAAMLLGVLPGAAARRGLEEHPSEFRRPRQAAPKGHTAGLLTCGFVVRCAGAAILSTLGFVLAQKLGRSVGVGGVVIGITTITGLLLAANHVIHLLGPVLGGVVDRVGRRRAAVLFFAVTTAILIAAASGPATWGLVCLVIAFFVSSTFLGVGLAAEASKAGSKAFAWYATAADFGAAVGPMVWMLLKYVPSLAAPFAIGAGLYGIGTVAAVVRLVTLPRAGRAANDPSSGQ